MKSFELSEKESKNGQRHFKVILHEVYPDSCIDEVNEVGNIHNENGITWIREYCEAALPSLVGQSIRCEFLDEDRTILAGHGVTEYKDGLPIFEDAVVIGTFTNGYITDIETDDGKKTVCIGEGTIDGLCYHNFTEKLEEMLEDGETVSGSVEILKKGDNPSIVYKYGYKEMGRIPMVFDYSGYALLGVRPADNTAKILEINESNKGEYTMSENEIKAIVTQTIAEMNSSAEEIAKIKNDYENEIAELQNYKAENERCTNELNDRIAELEAKIAALTDANTALEGEKQALTGEINALNEKIETVEKEKKLAELNSAIGEFTDEEKGYAQAEIDAFNANPLASEINSVVEKIHAGIGKKAHEEMRKASNTVEEVATEDIFSEINESQPNADEEVDIF